MKVSWDVAEPPLPPVAVAGRGTAGERLSERATGDPRWDMFRFSEWCVVIGDELPWIDGVIYLGVLPGTIDVLVPVHRRPRLHPGIVTRAVGSITGGAGKRVALIPNDDAVIMLRLASRT
jgi:hypothetical protein